jgi:hypothetical protein
MKREAVHALVLSVIVVACARPALEGPAKSAPGAASALFAYDVPAANPAVYESADSTRFTIEIGPMQEYEVNVTSSGAAELRFEPAGPDLRVTLRLLRFSGRYEPQDESVITAGVDDVRGAYVVRLTRGGKVEVEQSPEVSREFQQIAGWSSLVRSYFVPLPGRVVERGATWTDTIVSREEMEALVGEFRAVVTSTWSRDTVVSGRVLGVIDSNAETTLKVEGDVQGMSFVQRLSGQTKMVTLWDAERRLLVDRREHAELTGTIDLPGVGILDAPLRVEVRSHRALAQGGTNP